MHARPSALFAIAGAALSLAGCGSSSSGSTAAGATGAPASSAAASTAATSAATSAPASAAAGALKIAGFKYDPTPLTVTPGQVVSVTNTDSAQHTATSDTKGVFSADEIKTGKTVTFKAPTKPGTYAFHCEYHASMHGSLIVK